MTKIIVNKFGTLSRDEVDEMLGIKLQETRVYQDAMADGEARLVLRQLNRRVGSLPPQLSEQVTPHLNLPTVG